MKRFLKNALRHCVLALLLSVVFYVVSVYVVRSNVQATSVSARAVASGFDWGIMAGPSLNNRIEIVDLYDGPYTYEESEKLSCVLCFIPFSYTAQYLNDSDKGLGCNSVMWRDGSLLSRSGMLKVGNRFYFADYEDVMATTIDLFWERNGGSIGLSGVILDVTTETSPEVDTLVERMICTGVCLVSGRVGVKMAVVLFALLAGLIGYLIFLALYDVIGVIRGGSFRRRQSV